MKTLILTSLCLVLFGCEKAPKEIWQANKNVFAYANVNAAQGKAAFTIKKGEKCEAGETAYGKVDAYTKLNCESGSGWVTESEHFTKLPTSK